MAPSSIVSQHICGTMLSEATTATSRLLRYGHFPVFSASYRQLFTWHCTKARLKLTLVFYQLKSVACPDLKKL